MASLFRTKVLPLAAITGISLLATGCSLGSSSSNTSTTYRISIWRTAQDSDPFDQLIKQFQHDNSKVKITYHNEPLANYEQNAFKSMASGLGPDILSINNDMLGDDQSVLLPLPKDYFFPSGQTTGPTPKDAVHTLFPAGIANQITGTDGNVYGIPTNVDSLELYYNPDLFQSALQNFRHSLNNNYTDAQYNPVQQLLSKPPTTWTDLINQANYLNIRNGTTITRSAIALGTTDNMPDSADILQLLMLQNGAQIVSQDHSTALFNVPTNTPSGGVVYPGENALAFYTSFADPTKSNYSWNPSQPNALDAFGQGKVAMVIAYSDFGKQLAVKYPKFHPETAPVPQISLTQPAVNFIRYSIETVPKTAQSAAASFAFLKNYTDQSDSKSLASELKLRSPYLTTLNLGQQNDDQQSTQILSGQSVFKLDRPDFDKAFHDMIVDVTQNQVAVDQAMNGAANTITGLLTPLPKTNSTQ